MEYGLAITPQHPDEQAGVGMTAQQRIGASGCVF